MFFNVNFYMDCNLYMTMNNDNKKKDEILETKSGEKLDGKTLHDLYRHTTKLIK